MNPADLEHLLARLHLEAVLGVLPEFFLRDPRARELLPRNPFALRLVTGEGLSQILHFDSAGVKVSPSGPACPTLSLYFLSNQQLNRLFLRRGLVIPLPLGNPLLFPKLALFQKCMALLEPRLKSLQNPSASAPDPLDLWLQFSVALHGLDAVGTLDPKVSPFLRRCPRGLAEFSVSETDFSALVEWDGQSVRHHRGPAPRQPDARVRFASPDILEKALRQELDQMAAVSLGHIQVEGLIPLSESLGIVTDRISHYLQPQ